MANEQRNLDPGKRAICSRCGIDQVAIIIAPNNQFYCTHCFQQNHPHLYQQLVNWAQDHPPRKP